MPEVFGHVVGDVEIHRDADLNRPWLQDSLIVLAVRRRLSQLQAEAVAAPTNIVTLHASSHQHFSHGAPQVARLCSGSSSIDTRFSCTPNGVMSSQRGIGNFPHSVVAVEVAEVPIHSGANIDDQEIAVTKLTVRATGNDLVVPTLTGSASDVRDGVPPTL